VHQRADDFLRIMHVHLAAEGLKVKRFVLGATHRPSITQQNNVVLRLFLTVAAFGVSLSIQLKNAN
jgi:hypothetical protein